MSKDEPEPLVSDSGPLISLAENCLIWTLRGLANPVIIPKGVEYEAVIHPLSINKYEFNAMRIQQMIKEQEVIVDDRDIRQRTGQVLNLTNNLLYYKGKPIKIIHEGEAEVLALALERGLSTVLIDERTARLIVEDVEQVKKYMESRMDMELELNQKNAEYLREMFKDMHVLRSTELVIFAYENGFLDDYGKGLNVLEAALYAMKKSGCAVSKNEIEEYIALLKSK